MQFPEHQSWQMKLGAEGYIMEKYKIEYRDALVLKNAGRI